MSTHARSKHARPRSGMPRLLALTAGVGLLTFGAGWIHAVQDRADGPPLRVALDDRPPVQPSPPSRTTRGEQRPAPADQGLPGVSERTRARIPADSRQLVLVAGKGPAASEGTATLYTRPDAATPWRALASWPARNGARGWSPEGSRTVGDLTSPEGVFSLTDAGGLLPKPPGTRLPYDRDDLFVPSGRGVNGESLAGSFDYVVAIDFNRRPGRSPLDPVKPQGAARGGNIWLHVDHDGPSQGCVGIPKEGMRTILQTLDPAARPVIVMGPAGF
ncbi:hypothetical protein [Streptomyces antimicrobicus]|uniref:Lipoprotein n=1 Tax=Streptomyces antimicrobicus TaxID=2883108 RepID=A0ABS8B516_9ACTN|nr:hypothetical protein [Streptomyces antimicrobicus]MCB5179687.1 hypothetical protein [Streptomyces antimicrobicus]